MFLERCYESRHLLFLSRRQVRCFRFAINCKQIYRHVLSTEKIDYPCPTALAAIVESRSQLTQAARTRNQLAKFGFASDDPNDVGELLAREQLVRVTLKAWQLDHFNGWLNSGRLGPGGP